MSLLHGATGLSVGLAAMTFALGLRHGIDWDHIAAISDITSSQPRRGRSLGLATCYAAGHAAIVFVLGVLAIALGVRLPPEVDAVMGRVVGATLVVLGLYVIVGLVRHGAEFTPRSRWMLVIAAVRRVIDRRRAAETVWIEHDHAHADHHHAETASLVATTSVPAAAHATPGAPGAHAHHHHHRHLGTVPADPFATYGVATCLGVGVLHGLGAETPSQIVVLAAAAGVAGRAGGIAVLVAFLAGLLCSNTAVAIATTMGLRPDRRRGRGFVVLSALLAGGSVALGAVFLLGLDRVLPSLLS